MSIENRSAGKSLKIVDIVQKTVEQANTVNLSEVLQHYNIYPDEQTRKTICPFTFHLNGQERSASFYYYPESGTFYCFGCKATGRPVDFVSLYKNIEKYPAALAILNNFDPSQLEENERAPSNLKLLLDFSHLVRDFLLRYPRNDDALKYAEYICYAFDNVRNKYILDPDGLITIFDKLKRKLEDYT